eukprot:1153215-Pelagomonas_calceolata.AAC.4
MGGCIRPARGCIAGELLSHKNTKSLIIIPQSLKPGICSKMTDGNTCNSRISFTSGNELATGGEWKADLLFAVPRDHPEMQRLEGKYKK